MQAKKDLAQRIVRDFHSAEAAQKAAEDWAKQFQKDEVPEEAEAMITCPACRHQQPMPAKFCNECGSQLTPKPAAPPSLLICPQGHIYNSVTENCPYCERVEHVDAVIEAKPVVQQPIENNIEPATRPESPLSPDEPLRTTGSLPPIVEENSSHQARNIPTEEAE